MADNSSFVPFACSKYASQMVGVFIIFYLVLYTPQKLKIDWILDLRSSYLARLINTTANLECGEGIKPQERNLLVQSTARSEVMAKSGRADNSHTDRSSLKVFTP